LREDSLVMLRLLTDLEWLDLSGPTRGEPESAAGSERDGAGSGGGYWGAE
jgi:hypothetical protein